MGRSEHDPRSAPPSLPPSLEAELEAFEAAERERLGLTTQRRKQWVEPVHQRFTRAQRETTTVLLAGLTEAHDQILAASVRRLGYRVQALPTPDDDDFHQGKAYCDRAMCNPAYYTVGNLLRYLTQLRDEQGLTTKQINERYLLLTANGCGPCRFGLYINEYRKALREIGFDGFRVLLFNQTIAPQETGEGQGLEVTPALLFQVIRSLALADIVNLLKYRTRPYERVPGATDEAVARALRHITSALEERRGLISALRKVRREFAAVAVDRTRVKPKVAIIGEIWAQTTEGDGNYRLPAFLESEGAEVEIQPMTAWVLTILWEPRHDMVQLAALRSAQGPEAERAPRGLWWKVPTFRAVEGLTRLIFVASARLAGLHGYRLPDIDHMAQRAQPYYDRQQRGGEMFMEVAKLLHYGQDAAANLVVSVKPFGCMPSSGVSDGVQNLVAERFPGALFLSIETTGDSAVNVHSRLQMQLFKATQLAHGETERALAATGVTRAEALDYLARHPHLTGPLHRSPAHYACTTANLLHEAGRRIAP